MFKQNRKTSSGHTAVALTTLCAFSLLSLSGCGGGSSSNDLFDGPLDNHATITSGRINGNPADAAGVFSFKGIPYAAPPVGNLRWKAPQPVTAWTEPRDATQAGAQCWAPTVPGWPVVPSKLSEDCLTLNVWSGAKTRNAKLPVMVWIHEGGFQFGSSTEANTDGAALAKKGVVVVSLNYRLGVFGYLSRPDLDAESNGQKSGMYGIQDQIAALKWVRDNISAFGGDPANVTIFGESAGAHAAGILMSSPLAAGLFHKAIGQSGAFWESEMKSTSQAQAFGVQLSSQVNAPTLAALRAVPPQQLQDANAYSLALPTRFSPIVDGYVLPELPYFRFKNGRQNDVPLLAGWNLAEGGAFMGYSFAHDTVQAFKDAATNAFGATNLADFLQIYPASTVAEATQSAESLVGDTTIKYETWTWATQQQKTGRSPVYLYNFSFTSAFSPVPAHTNEISFVFGNLVPGPFQTPAAPTAQDRAVSDTMQTYWTNFARTGNPNGAGVPVWPQYAGAGSQAMQIGSVVQAGTEEGTARFQFLDKFRVDGVLPMGKH